MYGLTFYNGGGKVTNSIIYNGPSNSAAIRHDSSAALYVYNTTEYNFDAGIENASTGTLTVKNCAVFGNSGTGDDFLGTITIDNCASDDGDGTEPEVPSDWSAVFVDYTGGNFHLKSTDTDLKDSGTDLQSEGGYSDDIDGETRSGTWDIGADEYVAPATTTIGDGTSPSNKDVAPNSTNNAVDAFTLVTDTGTDTVEALTVTFTGTAVADVATDGVKIYDDSTGSTPNEWDSGDTLKGTASFSGDTASVTVSIPVDDSATQYLVTYDIASGATETNTLQGSITSATVSNILVNNDTTDATLTVVSGPDFKILRGTTVIAAASNTATISEGTHYTLESGVTINDAFIRITNTRLTGMGLTSGGGTQILYDFTVRIDNPENLLTSIDFRREGTTNDCRVEWEIIQYIGPASGANEIIVRGVGDVSTTGSTVDGTTLSNISNNAKVCVFITGQGTNSTTSGRWQTSLFTAALVADASDWKPQFTRGEAADTGYVSYAVVEFTGSNWRDVQRAEFTSQAHGATAWDTTNTTNSGTYSIPTALLDASKAFLHCQFRYDTAISSSGLDDAGENVELTTSLTQFTTRRKTATDETLKTNVVWVMETLNLSPQFQQRMKHPSWVRPVPVTVPELPTREVQPT